MKKELKIKILIIVFLLSVFMIPFSFAIFRSRAAITGSLSLAEWSVSLDQGDGEPLVVVPESYEASYTIKVRSNSEVDVLYSIVISNLPSGVEVSIDDGNTYKPQDSNHTITFSDNLAILYTDVNKEKTHTLIFRSTSPAEIVDNREVNIDVKFQQAL